MFLFFCRRRTCELLETARGKWTRPPSIGPTSTAKRANNVVRKRLTIGPERTRPCNLRNQLISHRLASVAPANTAGLRAPPHSATLTQLRARSAFTQRGSTAAAETKNTGPMNAIRKSNSGGLQYRKFHFTLDYEGVFLFSRGTDEYATAKEKKNRIDAHSAHRRQSMRHTHTMVNEKTPAVSFYWRRSATEHAFLCLVSAPSSTHSMTIDGLPQRVLKPDSVRHYTRRQSPRWPAPSLCRSVTTDSIREYCPTVPHTTWHRVTQLVRPFPIVLAPCLCLRLYVCVCVCVFVRKCTLQFKPPQCYCQHFIGIL